MFKLVDHAITPRKAMFQAALQRLPDAHRVAHRVGVEHLHQRMAEAAEVAGLDSSPIVISHERGVPFVGIEISAAGDALADIEFGHPEKDNGAPNPVLRTAARAAHPEANARYNAILHAGIGF